MIPELSGIEVFSLMKAINPETIILIVSGYSMNNEPEQLLNMGADGFLPKPFRLADLAVL